jgi:hypothetical protein
MKNYIFLLCFIFFNCKGNLTSIKTNSNDFEPKKNTKEDSFSLRSQNPEQDKKHIEIPVSDILPFGRKELITSNFSKKWLINPDLSITNAKQNKTTKIFNAINIDLQKKFDSYQNSNRFNNAIYDKLEGSYVRKQSIINDDLNNFLNSNINTIIKHTDNQIDLTGRLPDKYSTKVFLYTGKNTIAGMLYVWADLVTIKDNGEILGALNIYNYIQTSFVAQQKLFYIDENYIIHIKNFLMYEDSGNILESKMYQISSVGKFIRYYDKNDEFINKTENGLVKNNTKEGKWIEKRSNGYIDDYTYCELEYKGGEPINIGYFYEFNYEIDEVYGQPILNTGKKGKLIYTETYVDGEMKERNFVK